jgi:hypothetical protein
VTIALTQQLLSDPRSELSSRVSHAVTELRLFHHNGSADLIEEIWGMLID